MQTKRLYEQGMSGEGASEGRVCASKLISGLTSMSRGGWISQYLFPDFPAISRLPASEDDPPDEPEG